MTLQDGATMYSLLLDNATYNTQTSYIVENLNVIVNSDNTESYYLTTYTPNDGQPFYSISDFEGTVTYTNLGGSILGSVYLTGGNKVAYYMDMIIGCWAYAIWVKDDGTAVIHSATDICGGSSSSGTGSGNVGGSSNGSGDWGNTSGGYVGTGGGYSSSGNTISAVPNIPTEDAVEQKLYKSFLTNLSQDQYQFLAQNQAINDQFFFYLSKNEFSASSKIFTKWGINFFMQNRTNGISNISWTQFQPMLNFAQEFLSKNPDTINPEQIFNRLKSLDDLSKTNPDILLDIPCSQLPYWKDLANHQIPQQVKDKLKTANSNTHWYNSDLEIQNLDYSKSYTINMDVYPVKISTLPNKPGTNQKFTPAEFFNYFRLNINNFTDVNHGKFYPVVDSNIGINDTNLWNSSSPLGSLITIKIPLDEGTVICSGYNSQAWIFTTVKSPWDGEHPVSGNRLFGYYMDGSDMYIYTRGVDRFTSTYSTPEVIRELENLGYSKASDMWKNMQSLLSNFINSNNGGSQIIPGVDYIPNYIFVKEYLKGQRPISALGCH